METYPLQLIGGHLFITIDDHDWVFDTGAPTSFGNIPKMVVENRDFRIPDNYMGLTAIQLSGFVGRTTVGIIGADILNEFDIVVDVPKGQVLFSEASIVLEGAVIKIDEFMGIPIIQVNIDGTVRKMFFDSGAQISYFQDKSLTTFPAAGLITDFFPGFGQFQTETYLVDITFDDAHYTLRCGSLPGLLGRTRMTADTEGIIGNEILRNRKAGFFPRRRQLVLI